MCPFPPFLLHYLITVNQPYIAKDGQHARQISATCAYDTLHVTLKMLDAFPVKGQNSQSSSEGHSRCVFDMQEVLLFPAMKPDLQKKKDETDVKKSDELQQ